MYKFVKSFFSNFNIRLVVSKKKNPLLNINETIDAVTINL